MILAIHIPGMPVAKGRPRFTGNGHVFTPKKSRDWETHASWCAREIMRGRVPIGGPVTVEIIAVFPVPVSWPKWKQDAAYTDQLHHTTTPDCDNIAKAAKDAMNGIAWVDDAQVVSLQVDKRYGQEPGVYVSITTIDGLCTQTKHRPQPERSAA